MTLTFLPLPCLDWKNLLFWAASGLLDGFQVRGFWAALLGSLIYSVLMVIVDAALRGMRWR